MFKYNYSYEECLHRSEKVYWKIDDVLKGRSLDFSKRFLPERLAGAQGLDFLTDEQKLTLNQIRGFTYAFFFQLFEEYVIADVLDHSQKYVYGDETTLRALVRFAEEEIKHRVLFHRLADLFGENDRIVPVTIKGQDDVAREIRSRTPMAVLLFTLMLEWMTQRHYLEVFQDGNKAELDDIFLDVFKYHWLEEAQHTKLDVLELDQMAEMATNQQLDQAIDELFELCQALDMLLQKQVELDIETLAKISGRRFNRAEATLIQQQQLASYRYTFLISAMEQKNIQEIVAQISERGLEKLTEAIKFYTGAENYKVQSN